MNDTTAPAAKPEPKILTQFRKDIATHEMEVVLDQGMHRHLRFKRPGTNNYHFDIVTWPGNLAMTGDMGASVFSRLPDMFEFFRQPDHMHEGAHGLYINRSYWCEKLVANDGPARAYDQDLLAPLLRERFEDYMSGQDLDGMDQGHALAQALWEQIEEDVHGDNAQEAIVSADAFEPAAWSDHGQAFEDFAFTDMWECAGRLEDYTYHMTWRLYAVAHAVRAYDEWKAQHAPAEAPAHA
jgi:hypothetical protein